MSVVLVVLVVLGVLGVLAVLAVLAVLVVLVVLGVLGVLVVPGVLGVLGVEPMAFSFSSHCSGVFKIMKSYANYKMRRATILAASLLSRWRTQKLKPLSVTAWLLRETLTTFNVSPLSLNVHASK